MTVIFQNKKTGHALERVTRYAYAVRFPSGSLNGPYRYRDALALYRKVTAPRVLRWRVEVTDTFNGEANYSWARRYSFEAPEGASDTAIMRRAKREAGYTGDRGRVSNYGDSLEFRPYASCTVMLVTLESR